METRKTSNGQTSTFATKAFSKYDVILTDNDPLLQLPQKQSDDVFTTIAQEYAKLAPKARSQILKLYHPEINHAAREEAIAVHRAKTAAAKCNTDNTSSSSISTEELTRVFLVCLFNAFEGGLVYEQASRLNHSCNPNCMYTLNDQDSSIIIRSICNISSGEELTVSYLGIFLWSSRNVRRAKLQREKYFTCQCSRCTGCIAEEVASAIPCPKCHPRSHQHVLMEEVQWEDVNVSYCCPDYSNSNGDNDGVYKCAAKNSHSFASSSSSSSSSELALAVIQKVEEKVANRISSNNDNNSSNKTSTTTEDMAISQELDEQLFQMASSVLGAKHWTTNFMLLSLLDRSLSSFNAAMLLGECPDFEELAESIDSLERLWKFAFNFANGKLHVAHVPMLLLKQTVGVARSLVALGDVKSKKYASEWISGETLAQYGCCDLMEYVEAFEGKELLKVVQAIECAYKNGDSAAMMDGMEVDGDDDVDGNAKKRAKK